MTNQKEMVQIKKDPNREKIGYETGATREAKDGKGNFYLISPRVLRRLALHMEAGAKNHAPRNWEGGIPYSSFYDSMIRHLLAWLQNKVEGTKGEEDHLAAALWNLHGLVHTEEMVRDCRVPVSLDDIKIGREDV